jgi:hypothetical protein
MKGRKSAWCCRMWLAASFRSDAKSWPGSPGRGPKRHHTCQGRSAHVLSSMPSPRVAVPRALLKNLLCECKLHQHGRSRWRDGNGTRKPVGAGRPHLSSRGTATAGPRPSCTGSGRPPARRRGSESNRLRRYGCASRQDCLCAHTAGYAQQRLTTGAWCAEYPVLTRISRSRSRRGASSAASAASSSARSLGPMAASSSAMRASRSAWSRREGQASLRR